MKSGAGSDVVLDQFGRVDVDYYIARAHAERSKALRQLFSSLVGKLKSAIARKATSPLRTAIHG